MVFHTIRLWLENRKKNTSFSIGNSTNKAKESLNVSSQNPSIMRKINTIMGKEHVLSHEFKYNYEYWK